MGNRGHLSCHRIAVLALGVIVAAWLGTRAVEAQTFSPYSDFQAMTSSQLNTLQVKLTYVGAQFSVVPSLAFTSSSSTPNLSAFVPFRRPGISYQNDDITVRTFSASTAELQAIIVNVGTLPNVTVGGVAANIFLSFALHNSQPGVKAFDAVLDASDSAALFDQLRLSLANNPAGLRMLTDLACSLALTEAGTPTDVSASASVAFSGVRLDRKTGRFVGTATVTNNSGGTLAAPVSFVVIPQTNFRLANVNGTTCNTTPVGAPFINLPGGLAPGQSATVTLEFINPDRLAIEPTTKVLAGPGAR